MTTTDDVIVIGGGFAGLSAAVRLASDGARVRVVEARSRLGGRATSFPDPKTGETVDNGQHVLLGCYNETLAFLRMIGASDQVRAQPQLAVTTIDRAGRRTRLECPSLPSPLHLVGGVLDWDALGWRDRLAIFRMAEPLRNARRELHGSTVKAASPGETVENWLIRNGQTPRLREMLWDPLALAALNQRPDQAAAPMFTRVLAEMFGADPHAAAIVLPARPLETMYAEPARRYLESRGGAVETGAAARISGEPGAFTVSAGDARWSARAVISAVPWFALAGLFEQVPAALQEVVDRAARTTSCPIVTVNLWFDRRVMDEPFIGLPGRMMQWAFDKREIFGDGAAHLSLVSSGADAILRSTNEQLVALAHQEILEAIPQARAARLVHANVVREPRATPSLAPGQPARPSTETAIGGFFLAGDWIDTGLPATIESAVRSGHRAASCCIG